MNSKSGYTHKSVLFQDDGIGGPAVQKMQLLPNERQVRSNPFGSFLGTLLEQRVHEQNKDCRRPKRMEFTQILLWKHWFGRHSLYERKLSYCSLFTVFSTVLDD